MPFWNTSKPRVRRLMGCLLMTVVLSMGSRIRADEVPLTRIRSGHLTVGAAVNGHAMRLVVDTACPVTVIGEDAYQRLNLPESAVRLPARVPRLKSLNGRTTNTAYLSDLKIGDTNAGHRRVAIASLDAVLGSQFAGWSNAGADGILGADILADHHAIIDFIHGKLTLDLSPAARRDPARAASLADHTPVRLSVTNRGHFAVPCIIGDEPGRLAVDTGSPNTVMRRAVVNPGLLAQTRRVSLMRTLSGVTPVVWVPLRRWNIGTFPVSEARVGAGDFQGGIFAERTRSGGQVVGLLGLEWLTQWQAVVDFGAGTLYLKHRQG